MLHQRSIVRVEKIAVAQAQMPGVHARGEGDDFVFQKNESRGVLERLRAGIFFRSVFETRVETVAQL